MFNKNFKTLPGAIFAWPTIIVSLIPEFKELSPVFVR